MLSAGQFCPKCLSVPWLHIFLAWVAHSGDWVPNPAVSERSKWATQDQFTMSYSKKCQIAVCLFAITTATQYKLTHYYTHCKLQPYKRIVFQFFCSVVKVTRYRGCWLSGCCKLSWAVTHIYWQWEAWDQRGIKWNKSYLCSPCSSYCMFWWHLPATRGQAGYTLPCLSC